MEAAMGWRDAARERAIEQFRLAWGRAPASGRAELVERARKGTVGHRWETGSRACVLALLVTPTLRPRETAKAGAYRLFGCEVTDDFPVTWDAHGVAPDELLAAVGVSVGPRRRRLPLLRPVSDGA
jgi:hypothetical protein